MYNRKLCVIITASPIKSHPSTKHIDETIKSLGNLILPEDTKIILAHDYHGNSELTKGYLEYIEVLSEKYKNNSNFIITVRESHGHLTGNVRNAFNYVDSKYVLLVQHDFPFIRTVDIVKVIEDMDNNPNLKNIRFNKRKNVEDHCDKITMNRSINIFNNYNVIGNYEYVSTPCWSDNNHISPSQHYRDVILEECNDRSAMELVLYPKLQNIYRPGNESEYLSTHEKYGTFLFDKLNADTVIFHSDGAERYIPESRDHEDLKPMMTNDEFNLMVKYLTKDDTMLEFGSGGSTKHISNIVKNLYSLEHDKKWFEKVKEAVSDNVDLRHVTCHFPNNNVHCDYEDDRHKQYWEPLITGAKIFNIDRFDKVLIDARARAYCAIDILKYIDSDSIVFIHDYMNRPKYHNIVETYYKIIEHKQTMVVLKKR